MRGSGRSFNAEKFVPIFLGRLVFLATYHSSEFATADRAGLSSSRAQAFIDDVDRQAFQARDCLGGVALRQKSQQDPLLFRQTIKRKGHALLPKFSPARLLGGERLGSIHYPRQIAPIYL